MSLAETVTYNDVVSWLTTGTVNYCYNIDTTKYNSLPACIRTANWSKTATLYEGSVSGKHGSQHGRCKITISLSPGSSNIKSVTQATVQTRVETYIKKVNSTLTASVTNAKIQGLFDAILCYCNDNIKVVACTCPGYSNLQELYYAQYPIYSPGTMGTVDFNTSITITASQMIKSLNDFSTFYRKYVNPKIVSLTYTVSTFKD